MIEDTETLVCEDIKRRQQIGIQKYKTTVATNPLSLLEWMKHHYEELLDAAVYSKRIIQEFEQTKEIKKGKWIFIEALYYITVPYIAPLSFGGALSSPDQFIFDDPRSTAVVNHVLRKIPNHQPQNGDLLDIKFRSTTSHIRQNQEFQYSTKTNSWVATH